MTNREHFGSNTRTCSKEGCRCSRYAKTGVHSCSNTHYEAISEGIEEDVAIITQKVMLILAIATSIDAMAAGFTLNLLEVNPLLACGIIGSTTFIFSLVGVFVGAKSGTWLESKAELLGGTILILIGFKILIF